MSGSYRPYYELHVTMLGASMVNAAAAELAVCGATILRRKAEMVLYDDRSAKVQCLGGCPECNTEEPICVSA